VLSSLVLPTHVPRAHRDPITSASAALTVFSLAITRPLRPETLVLMMRKDHRGVGLVALETGEHLSLLIDDVISHCVSQVSAQAVAIASVRPQWPARLDGAGALDGADELAGARDSCHRAGIQLVDWFIVANHGVHCQRVINREGSLWRN